jgi:hypothetical protein
MLTTNASAEENKSFIDQCKPCVSEVNLAKGSALEAAGEEGSKLVGASVSRLQPDELPATPPSKRIGRPRKTSNSLEPVKEASVQAFKKSKILHEVAAPPVTSIVREEIGALSALPIPPSLLDEAVMRTAIDHLRTADAGLAVIIEQHTPPSYASGEKISPFKALVKSIIYQQLAGKAASTIHGRLVDLLGGPESVTPGCILAVDAEQLRSAGISRQKVRAWLRHFYDPELNRPFSKLH